MRDIWFISDTHFNHSNILNFRDSATGDLIRPEFSNSADMDNFILEQWNTTVKPGDIVYHLGDVMFGDKEYFKSFWPKLHGSKRLIVGNHDDIVFLSSGGFFKKIQESRTFRDQRLLCTHRPIHLNDVQTGDPQNPTLLVNVHGHIHQNKSPTSRHINISVEAIGYTPVHIDTLAAQAKKILDL